MSCNDRAEHAHQQRAARRGRAQSGSTLTSRHPQVRLLRMLRSKPLTEIVSATQVSRARRVVLR
jgi:hypothetical protein